MPFKLEQTNAGIGLALTPDTLSIESHGSEYRASFQSGADTVSLTLSPDLLSILGLQCLVHLPELAPQQAVPKLEDSYRLSAGFIKALDNRSLQCLLRECEYGTLTCFLWYMKDGDLIRNVFSNLSQRAAEMLMDDLELNWRARNPDDTANRWVRHGRAAVLKVLALTRQLANEGQIEETPPSLTTKEIDALLKGLAGDD